MIFFVELLSSRQDKTPCLDYNPTEACSTFGSTSESDFGTLRIVQGPPEQHQMDHVRINNEPKTNNTKETWHNRFQVCYSKCEPLAITVAGIKKHNSLLQTMVGKSRPSLFPLIVEFKKEQGDMSVMITELSLGKQVKQPQRLKYQRINQRLQRLAGQYNNFQDQGRRLKYLRDCSHAAGL